MSDSSSSCTIAEYLVTRINALGPRHLFTVPGNYCADFLSTAQGFGKIQCIGTTNEMEAGYAADACARLCGIGVVCVTYGVGSFSLLNAIAGAFVERCPVILINGTANADKARALVQQGVLFAHAIDTLRTDQSIFKNVTADSAVITNPPDAPAQIDRVLRACVAEKRPVYIEVPDGVWKLPCARPSDPDVPLAPLPLLAADERDVDASVDAAVREVLQRLATARRPVLWGGEELARYGLQDTFDQIIRSSGLPYTTTLLGKSLVAEDNPQFIGVYDSIWAPDDTKTVVENADCLLALGTILSDLYGAIVAKSYDTMILAAGGAVRFGRHVYPRVPLDRFVRKLAEALGGESSTFAAGSSNKSQHTPPSGFEKAVRVTRAARGGKPARLADSDAGGTPLTWENFFVRMRDFIKPEHVVLADTSLGLFPAADLFIPRRSHFIAQTAWLSIGYTVGAIVGVSMTIAGSERAVAFAGDGGFQMIPQAMSTLARNKKPAILFIFDNGLYGIEQFLIDKTYYQNAGQPPVFFNELARWDYVKLAEAFGGKGHAVATLAQLDQALAAATATTEAPTLIAIALDPRTVPPEIARTLSPATAAGLVAGGTPQTPTIATAAFN